MWKWTSAALFYWYYYAIFTGDLPGGSLMLSHPFWGLLTGPWDPPNGSDFTNAPQPTWPGYQRQEKNFHLNGQRTSPEDWEGWTDPITWTLPPGASPVNLWGAFYLLNNVNSSGYAMYQFPQTIPLLAPDDSISFAVGFCIGKNGHYLKHRQL